MMKNKIVYGIFVFCMVVMASYSARACSNPTGVEGEIIYNGTHNVPTYCDGTNWIAMTGGDDYYVPNAVTINKGTEGDQLTMSSHFTDMPPSKAVTGSIWFRSIDGGEIQFLTNSGADGFTINIRPSSGQIVFNGDNSSSTEILRISKGSIVIDVDTWYHILYSFDLSNPSAAHFYLDDIDVSPTFFIYVNDLIDFDNVGENPKIPGNPSTSEFELADFWFETDLYIDLSVEANRRKFIDASGNPVYLGANGERPTGESPDVFLSGDTDDWHTNKGTGGGFTENGALTTATTSPYTPRTAIVPNGLVGHWRLDETSGNIAADTSGNGYDGIMQNDLEDPSFSVPGVIGQARIYEGLSKQIEVNHGGGLDNLNQMTISAWVFRVNNGGAGQGRIVEIPGSFIFRLFGDNRQSFVAQRWGTDGSWRGGPDDAPVGQWYHYAVTYDYGSTANEPTFYVNGEVASVSFPSAPTGSVASVANNLFLGNGSGGLGLGGGGGGGNILDDVRIYNRILDADEIAEIAAAKDGIRYNASEKVPEYFDGNKFIPMRSAFPNPTDGLIGHWKLDETSGTTAVDSSGNGNDGTLEGGLDATNDSAGGPVGRSLNFSGVNNEFIQDPSGFPSLSGDSTMAFWMKPSSYIPNFNRNILGTSAGTNGVYGLRIFGTGRLMLRIVDISNSISAEISDGSGSSSGRFDEWRHYSISRSTVGTIKWYENGVHYRTDAGPINFNPDSSFFLGDGAIGNDNFMGALDDVRVYNRVLSDAEISQLYQMGAPLKGPEIADLVGYWKLDETSGTTAIDSSGNGYDGTMRSGLSASTDSVPAIIDSGLEFDGSGKYFDVRSDPADLRMNQGKSMTFSSWVKLPTGFSTGANIFLYDDLDNSDGDSSNPRSLYSMRIRGDNRKPRIEIGPSNTVLSSLIGNTALSEEEWTHVTWVRDVGSDELRIYINGNIDSSSTDETVGTWETTGQFLNVGRFDTSVTTQFLDAQLDDLRIYDRALTDDEIKQLYYYHACTNPLGPEGQMTYNTTHDVVQYCDGARWIGIGKSP